MEAIFLKLVNQSIAASGFILLVLMVRLCFRRLSGNVRCILWALAAASLILPLSLRIPLSLKMTSPFINTFSEEKSSFLETFLQLTEEPYYRLPDNSVTEKTLKKSLIAAVIWLVFCFSFLIYMLLVQILLYKKLRVSFLTEDNYRICDQISDAFVIGFIHPCIYLPSDLEPAYTKFILAHEKAHISRRDYLWKPLGYILLSIYCFNPLIWISYLLFCRDIEIACDEKVIQNMNIDERIFYSNMLLRFSIRNQKLSICSPSFGKNSLKERIKFVMNYKKPSKATKRFSIMLCVLLFEICTVKLETRASNLKSSNDSPGTVISDSAVTSIECSFGFSDLTAGELETYPETILVTDSSEIIWSVNYIQMGLSVEIILIDENGNEIIQNIEGGSGTGVFSELSEGDYQIAVRCSESNLQNKLQRTLTGTACTLCKLFLFCRFL